MKVLVTGAAAGLGHALTRQLVKDGHFVIALDAVVTGLDKLEREYKNKVRTLLCDVANETELRKAKRRLTVDELPEVVVNNAAIGRYGTIEELTVEQWRRQLDVNLTGPFLVTKTFLPELKKARGKLMNIGSVRATEASPRYAGYCASKFGLRGFSLCAELELAPEVATTIVELGQMITEFGDLLEQRRQQQKEGVPLLHPNEVATVLVDYITGKRPWKGEITIIPTKNGLSVT